MDTSQTAAASLQGNATHDARPCRYVTTTCTFRYTRTEYLIITITITIMIVHSEHATPPGITLHLSLIHCWINHYYCTRTITKRQPRAWPRILEGIRYTAQATISNAPAPSFPCPFACDSLSLLLPHCGIGAKVQADNNHILESKPLHTPRSGAPVFLEQGRG